MKSLNRPPASRLKFINLAMLCSMMSIAVTPAAVAGSLGRLFFTPEQRAQLDQAHARSAAADGRTSSVVTVNGIVQKQGGARTVWINGVAQTTGNSSDRNPAAQIVKVPGKSRPVKIKVGEILPLDQPATAKPDSSGE